MHDEKLYNYTFINYDDNLAHFLHSYSFIYRSHMYMRLCTWIFVYLWVWYMHGIGYAQKQWVHTICFLKNQDIIHVSKW